MSSKNQWHGAHRGHVQPLNAMVMMILADSFWISWNTEDNAIGAIILSRNPRQNV